MGPAHLGVGFAAKAMAPKAPLWSLLVASEALDLLCAITIPIGIERMSSYEMNFTQGIQTIAAGSVPWSHGLFMTLIWSLLFGALAYLFTKNQPVSIVIGLVVISHWILDLIVHPPDLYLFFEGSPIFGLGLWASGPGLIASLVLEFALLGSGLLVYIRWRNQHRAQEKI